MIQNQDHVTVYFLSFHGQLALGITLPIAALGGALVVSIVGAVRIIQLRTRAHSASKSLAKKRQAGSANFLMAPAKNHHLHR